MTGLRSPRRGAIRAAAGAVLLLAGCSGGEHSPSDMDGRKGASGSSPSVGEIDPDALQGRIIFGAGGTTVGSTEIYVMRADGSGLTRLTDNQVADFDPAWSPDGSRIAFRSQRDGNDEIYVMNVDGSDPRNVSRHPAVDWGPDWSPDGRSIAFNSGRPDGQHLRGFVTDVNGGEVRNLGEMFFEYAAWSPDGRRMAFMHQTFEGSGGNYDIYVMNADGSGVRQLTETAADDGWPAWSPDGSRIVFSSIRDDCLYSDAEDCLSTGDIGPFHTLYVMDADGSDERRITDVFGQFAVWSPDGRYIAFTPGPSPGGVHVMRPDGSGVTRIPIDGGVGMPDLLDWVD